MHRILRLHQQLYNGALEERIGAYKKRNKSLTCFDQNKELTQLRKELSEYSALNAQSLQVTMKRLDLAFKAFFRRLQNGETPGFPRFKSIHRYKGWGYATHGDGWRLFEGQKQKHGKLRLSGIGHVKIRGKARNIGTPKTCEIQHKQGRWYASVTIECAPKRESGTSAIGIDWGLETFATLADANGDTKKIKNPRFLRKKLKSIRTEQRGLSRKKRGSKNRNKARKIVGKLHAKVANQRQEFLHQTTARLVKESALIATEKLNVKGMSSHGGAYKKGLNREILSAAPGVFHQMLKAKAEEAEIELIEIPTRQVKPSQTCHGCGNQEKKTLAKRRHVCGCGVSCGRDENAAKVILNWALVGNATGWEPARCGASGLPLAGKHETPPITALAV